MKLRGNKEAGFALLLVYAMAATVAILLYMQLPRVAFEAQRDKEQLLIDRGEEYSRGIQLFVRKFNRYPADFDALEKTATFRFIRHRYKDPLARTDPNSSASSSDSKDAKDGWRIIHVGPGGVFTDSLLYTKKKDDKAAEKQTFITEIPPVGADLVTNGAVNLADRRRPSDQAGAPGDPNNPSVPAVPGIPGTTSGVPGVPQFDANGQPIPQNPAVSQLQGTQVTPGVNGAPSTAVGLINNLLTTPRPGGAPNAQPGFGTSPTTTATTAATATTQPTQIGGGIAGVASKIEQDGIKVYRDRKAYNEWEFVYDITQDKSKGGATVSGQAPTTAVNPASSPTGVSTVTPVATPTPAPTSQ